MAIEDPFIIFTAEIKTHMKHLKSTRLYFAETQNEVVIRVGDRIKFNVNDQEVTDIVADITEETIEGTTYDLTYIILENQFQIVK